jgi:hypothetical protein
MNLSDFNKAFIHKYDKIDSWRALSLRDPSGDCDDYATTVAYILVGSTLKIWFAVLTRRVQFWYCRDPNGESHMQLYVRGKGWIENWYKEWGDKPHHVNRFRAPLPLVIFKMAFGKIV